MTTAINFDNRYAQLPERFFSSQAPTPVASPNLLKLNLELAEELGLSADWLSTEQGTAILSGNQIPDGATPIAAVYAGHQFGNWNPQLGDGRAVLLGEVISPKGSRYDLQLKGSGPTPYSRGGDGRAPVGPVIREYIVSEAMQALGVPTSRSLAAVTTGEHVMREQIEPGAVLTRVSSSHIRVGSFQFFAARGDTEAVKLLADHSMQRHYAEAADYQQFLLGVIDKTATLIAHWQQLGFIHGVMNTDNQLISGETIDYGPCAFLDVYQPDKVFSSIDQGGRYAYQNQPGIAHWNLAQFAQCLVPLLHDDEEKAIGIARECLDEFPDRFYAAHRQGMAEKIGFENASDESDELIRELLSLMATHQLDFTQTFSSLSSHQQNPPNQNGKNSASELHNWFDAWQQKKPNRDLIAKTNPVVIPRNHHIEAVIQAALKGDYDAFHNMVEIVTDPFNEAHRNSDYSNAPRQDELVQRTFCGT